jgi:AcrR family transcriptional regulator
LFNYFLGSDQFHFGDRMGRRSDHTREELKELLIAEGSRQLDLVGLSRFSARDVAKRVGYSVGTLYNIFGSYDGMILAINARTLASWIADLKARLAGPQVTDRIAELVYGYFAFATSRPKAWIAIYEHNMADGGPAPDWYLAVVAQVMRIAEAEIGRALPEASHAKVASLARSLVATVHGHCSFSLYRTFDLLGETAPAEAALARVREAIDAARA